MYGGSSNMGKSKSKKAMRDLKIAEGLEQGLSPEETAVYAGCTENVVLVRMGELITEKERKVVLERDVDGMVSQQLDKMEELWQHHKHALSDSRNPLEEGTLASQGLKFIETYYKMMAAFGIAVPKSEHLITIHDIRDTPEYKQFIALFEEWCMSKGLDITEFFKFVDRKTRGTRKKQEKQEKVIDVEAKEVEEDEKEL
jgi:hypothetical protein